MSVVLSICRCFSVGVAVTVCCLVVPLVDSSHFPPLFVGLREGLASCSCSAVYIFVLSSPPFPLPSCNSFSLFLFYTRIGSC